MIRRATIDDAATLTTLAVAAKRYWGYPENWIEQWRNELTISKEYVNDNEVYVLTSDDEVRAFYGMVLRKQKAELEHLWVDPQYIGTGIGRKLFVHALQL